MAIVINGSGTVTGLAVGGLPDGTVDEGTLATDSVTAAKIPASLENTFVSGRKNMVINGDMKISQRTTSTTGVTSATYGACDRYKLINSGLGTFTISQENDAPAGFHKSFKMNCTTAYGSAGSGDYNYVSQKIESQDTKHLAYGTSSAKTITLSFWVKCSQTGTLQAGIVHYASSENRHIGGTYTINAANTWEKKTMTFVGDTAAAGAGNFDTARGFEVEWFLASGSDRTSGSVPSSWGTMAQTNRNAGSNISIGDSTSDTWQITGVQLELGSTATDFEHRSYGEELALCQRYYYLHATKEGGAHPIGSAAFQTTNFADFNLHFPTTMRTKPTLEYVSGTDYYSVYANDQLDHFSGFATRNTSPNAAQIYTNGGMGTGITAGKAGVAYTRNDNAFMAFTAEL